MPGNFDVNYVAHLARIALTPEEEEKFGAQLSNILGYIEKLNELDVSGIEPTAHAVPLVNVFRPDEVAPLPDQRGSAAQRAGQRQRACSWCRKLWNDRPRHAESTDHFGIGRQTGPARGFRPRRHAGLPGPNRAKSMAASTPSSVMTPPMPWRKPMPPTRPLPAERHIGKSRLLGMPIALKDVIAVRGQPLNCGSKILGKFISPYSATVVEKLQEAGAVVFGRLNMDEFAMGSSTENSAFGVTRNPWDPTRIPGGSSGGSAAAVAADECIAALGSDTGGSIRQPAALCGCVGFKPTYGRVSRYGLVAFASSLDQIGPFARDVRDAATVLGAISGHDPRDSTSVPSWCRIMPPLSTAPSKDFKLGLAKEYMIGGLDPEVAASGASGCQTI